MHPRRLGWAELVGVGSALLLVGSLWLPWFETAEGNPNSTIDGQRGLVTAWEAYTTLPFLLILGALAPVVLAWIVLRGHELAWNRGELTTVLGIVLVLLIIGNGILFGRPGSDPFEVSLFWGYLIGITAALGIIAAGVLRQAESPPKPSPPGV